MAAETISALVSIRSSGYPPHWILVGIVFPVQFSWSQWLGTLLASIVYGLQKDYGAVSGCVSAAAKASFSQPNAAPVACLTKPMCWLTFQASQAQSCQTRL